LEDCVRVLGVDPGTIVMGWGVLECEGPRLRYVSSGVVRAGRGDLGARLAAVQAALVEVISMHAPEVLSLERNFLAANVQSAFRLGEARGVAMAAAASRGLALCEYTPATIKKSIVGHGRADKAAVQTSIARLLGLPRRPEPDEADALAAAACHGLRAPYESKLAAALEGRRIRLVRRR
jgi:crossover junction endodeoxyribonuclease RuvC